MHTSPLVSVVIPAYNHPELLFDTIQSVLNQSYGIFELLIVDDGSEIDITSAIESFRDDRIRYYRIKHQNANVARNYGIAHSKGDYIAMLDADDLWMKNHIEDCLDSIEDSDGLYGGLILHTTHADPNLVPVRALKEGETIIDYLLTTGYGAQTSTLFLTASSAKEIGWDESLKRHQDYDFVVRYHKKYTLKPKKNITVNYLLTGKQVAIDFDSCIRFVEKNEDDISPMIYNSYHVKMLRLAQESHASHAIIAHYRNEATRYMEYVSFINYIVIKEPQTRYEQIRCWLSYACKVLKFVYRLE